MPREERLFGDVVDPSVKMGNRQRTSVAVTIVLEALLVAVFITIPLLATDVLPAAPDMMNAFVAAEPPPAPPPPPRGRRDAPSKPATPVDVQPIDAAPVKAPDDIAPEQPIAGDNRIELGGASNVGGPIGDPNGAEFGVPGAPPAVVPKPAPVVKEIPRVGGIIQAPRKIKDVRPVYPPIAQQAHVQGRVILEATIGANGRVINVQVLQSRPLLDQAAIDAVRQWEFTPTLLNGEPTAVIMNVTVNFQLN